MRHLYFLIALVADLVADLVAGGVAPLKPRNTSKTFSLAVAEKPGHTRDFVHDWAAAHQKWGKGVPEGFYSMFSLANSGGICRDWTASLEC